MSLHDLENLVQELSEAIKDAYEAHSNDDIGSAGDPCGSSGIGR